jgi:AcrR family transcriptional regulator
MKITLDKIVEISIHILKEKGINGLSIREISNKLKIKSSSLYWHIKTKQEIYSKISDKLWENIRLSKNLKDPRKILFDLNLQFRKELLKINGLTEIIRKTHKTSNTYFDESINCLINLKIKNKYYISLVNMLMNFVLCFVENA